MAASAWLPCFSFAAWLRTHMFACLTLSLAQNLSFGSKIWQPALKKTLVFMLQIPLASSLLCHLFLSLGLRWFIPVVFLVLNWEEHSFSCIMASVRTTHASNSAVFWIHHCSLPLNQRQRAASLLFLTVVFRAAHPSRASLHDPVVIHWMFSGDLLLMLRLIHWLFFPGSMWAVLWFS